MAFHDASVEPALTPPRCNSTKGLTTFSSSTTLASSTPSKESDPFDLNKVDDNLFKWHLSQYPCEEILAKFKRLSLEAGQMMLDAQPVTATETKNNTSDIVTETDKRIEDFIKHELNLAYPEYDFFGEETSKKDQKLTDKPTFICDPIDGTLNFTHGLPNFCISLGFTIMKRPAIGVVYNPLTQYLFFGTRGQGSYLQCRDNKPLRLPIQRPTPIGPLGKCIMGIEWGNDRQGARWELRNKVHKQLLTKNADGEMIQSVRSMGSAALAMCNVAAGWLDAFWEAGCWPWDVCAGWAILEEAGGRVFSANPYVYQTSLESRLYFATRAASEKSQEWFAQTVWNLMGDERFDFSSMKKKKEEVESDDDGLIILNTKFNHTSVSPKLPGIAEKIPTAVIA